MASENKAAISLRALQKKFGSVTAVENLNLEIQAGEFFSMLGPSGSGKTTVLRLIAGFEQPTAGTVTIFGDDVTNAAPFDRDVNTVFQDYALFPHMDVLDNVAYGLKVRGVAKSERYERAKQALQTVQLDGFDKRKPSQLSGGQRQRVALARAIVVKPKVLLLDEPLGALDLKLREQMQVELKALQRKLGITFIFVTHDQEEALTLSDRVAVFNQGRIEQLGTPRELYENPASRFVAGFVGSSNIFTEAEAKSLLGKTGMYSIRPERVSIGAKRSTGISLAAKVEEVIYLGASNRVIAKAGDKSVVVLHSHDDGQPPARGESVHLNFEMNDLVALSNQA